MRAHRLILVAGSLLATLAAQAGEMIQGEILDASSYGPGYVESMQAAIERDRLAPAPVNGKDRQPGQHGIWIVPSRGATCIAHSGEHYATNKWGDTCLGIGFTTLVDVHGAWFAGQAAEGVWTTGLRVRGYRDDQLIAETGWFRDLGAQPHWMSIDLQQVDRIEVVSIPVVGGGGWYAMDDLTFSEGKDAEPTVVDFDDLSYRYKLSGSDYAGLQWEIGTGDFSQGDAVHGPLAPSAMQPRPEGRGDPQPSPMRGTAPNLLATHQGVIRGDASSMSYPPDSDGAIGPNHYVETVNRNFAVYDKVNGAELTNILLGSFLPGSNGDPRVLYDHHSNRWIVHVTDFSATATIFLAVSLTDDPMGDWFKTSFLTAQGPDAGRWPDYPTLGVDHRGVYIAAYMVGGNSMTIFALDKEPLIAANPSLGTITAFRNLPWEGAIQPAHTYGTPAGEYLVSLDSSTGLRLRRVNNSPYLPWSLTELGVVNVPAFSAPPNAPALGSSTPINTVDDRLMMAAYRDGSLWTAHTIAVNGRAACRWYEIDVDTLTLVQHGNVADTSLHYYFPSIMVNQTGDAVMGFTGSNSTQYAACYYTGRQANDPLGNMAPPVMFKVGTGPQNNVDGYGRNRWGDYSYTTLDPTDESTFWTIQEYGHASDIWGTYIAVLSISPPDCNNNGIPDPCDIDCGPPGSECDVPGCGQSADCNLNGVPDECEWIDCNANGILDECDLATGTSQDCNANEIPDECDIADGISTDCQPNGVPDECEIGTTSISITYNLDTDPGWSTQDLWTWGQPTGGGGQYGGPDPTGGHTGANVYGYNLSGDYQNNLPERHLTSHAIDCTNLQDVRLSFWRWLGVEQPAYDHATVSVSNDATNWNSLWTNTAEVADTSWQYQEFDISSVAADQPTIYLRWTMGPTDTAWQFCGWNIDDIEIQATRIGGGAGDCNANAIPDACDIADGTSQDCQLNGVPDECDIADGTSLDQNANGIPDECEATQLGDLDCDGDVDFDDINPFVLALSGQAAYTAQYPDCVWYNADCDEDGDVDFDDINPFVSLIGN